jgi:hypothetical protein
VKVTPLPIARFAHASLGVVALVVGVGLWRDRSAPGLVAPALAVLLVGIGVVLVVRSVGMGVECRDGVVCVRGLFLTRTVPRVSIERVTTFPALMWRDDKGRRRWTPVMFLADSPRTWGYIRRYNASELDRLRGWIGRPRR